jgi:hypothetical protein
MGIGWLIPVLDLLDMDGGPVTEETGGYVCATVTVSPRVAGTVTVFPRVAGTAAVSPRVAGTVELGEC